MQRLSYMSAPRCTPYHYSSIVDLVKKNDRLHPDQEILIHRRPNGERLSITNRALHRRSTILANHLIRIGVGKDQYVGIAGPNTIEWVIGELAILKTGAVSMHLSSGTNDAQDVMDIIENINCRHILMDPGVDMAMVTTLQTIQSRITKWNESEDRIKTILLRSCGGLDSFLCLDNILENDSNYVDLPLVDPENTAVIFCTSGSTGKSKLVQVDHVTLGNVLNGFVEDGIPLLFNDRPFEWYGGSPLPFLADGIPRLFTDCSGVSKDGYAQYAWESMKKEGCKHALLIPFLLYDICEYKIRNPNDQYLLTWFFTGGQLIDNKCKAAIGVICSDLAKIGYGSTECGFSAVKILRQETTFLTGDVGYCLPGAEIKIIDKDGDVALLGNLGEICIRSNCLSKGYLNAPEMNRDLFIPGGWMRTSDLGKINEEGHLIIVGKMKMVISRGTRKIIPAMIEEIVSKIPGLKEVYVIPVPDKRLHEEVCVCYKSESESNLDPDELKRICGELFLKTGTLDGMGESPTYFVHLENIPLLQNGKVDKVKLQKLAISFLGL